MGLMSSIFGKSGSDKADQMRQKAIDAFNKIKTPDLSALQVQLNDYVNQGKITPEQAEATLLNSNAFNSIATDPSNVGAQKLALKQLQDIGVQGGMTAIDRAQMQDITDEQNQQNRSQNEATMQRAQQRGVGGSGVNQVNDLINQQASADRAARSGVQVAANAQQRALQAMQAAGQLGGQMEAQQYGQQANKANAQNAIEQFNAATQTANNQYNTGVANNAQAANVAQAQRTADMNTQTQNANKEYNAQQNQAVFNNELAKANGVAGTYNNWANDASAAAAKDKAADVGLTSGLIGAGVTAFGGPVAGMFAGQTAADMGGTAPKKNPNPTFQFGQQAYAEGGEVTSDDEEDFNRFMVEMSSGGKVEKKPKHEIPINYNTDNNSWDVTTASNTTGGSYPSYIEAAQQAEKLKEHKMAEGGEVEESSDTAHIPLSTEPQADDSFLKRIASLLSKNADKAKEIPDYSAGGACMADGGQINMDKEDFTDEHNRLLDVLQNPTADKTSAEAARQKEEMAEHNIADFRSGGHVPGKAKVMGNSKLNDTVPAMLSPGEVVLPRTVVQNPKEIPPFVEKAIKPKDEKLAALRALQKRGK